MAVMFTKFNYIRLVAKAEGLKKFSLVFYGERIITHPNRGQPSFFSSVITRLWVRDNVDKMSGGNGRVRSLVEPGRTFTVKPAKI